MKEFHIHVDASPLALGVILAWLWEGAIDHLIAFTSQKIFIVEKNYSVKEREGLAMVYALYKMGLYEILR